MNEDQFKEINAKLEKIVLLLTHNLLKEIETQKDKILFLYSLNYKPLKISRLLRTSSNTVNVRLSEARKEGIIK